MPAGRPNRPLFDLIAEETADGRRRSATPGPVAAVELKPAPAALAAESVDADIKRERPLPYSRTTPRGMWGSLMATGRASVELTTPWLAAATAIVLGVILAVWIIAYKMGESDATVRLAGGVGTAPPRSDPKPADRTAEAGTKTSAPGEAPSETPIGRTGETAEGAGVTLPNPVSDQVASDPLPKANQTDSGTVVAYTGSYESDPRVPGKNYLLLASSMSRQDARDAVDFLGRNGFAALGVPYGAVDRTGREGKNDPLYKLVSAQGFDSSDMKESQAKREAIATEAGKLGLIYQRQHRGKYNFAKVNWEKYVR